MKRNFSYLLILIFLLTVNMNVLAIDKLVTVPTADLIGDQGFVYGEIIGSSEGQLEGVYNINPNLGLGGMIKYTDDEDTDLGLLVKTILINENDDQPAISAGIRDEDLYLVTSKNLAAGFRGHLGIGNGDFEGLFVGFNKVLNPVTISQPDHPSLPIIDLMGEYINEEVNLNIRMNLQDNLKLDLGLLDFDKFKFGIGYVF